MARRIHLAAGGAKRRVHHHRCPGADAYAKQAGRPITLAGSETRAWCTRGALATLHTWASQPGQAFTLALRGTTHSVVFNHDGGALSAEPVLDRADPTDADPCAVTLRFLEV